MRKKNEQLICKQGIKTIKWKFIDIIEIEKIGNSDLEKQKRKIEKLDENKIKLETKYEEAFIRDQQRLLEGEVDIIGHRIEKTIISKGKLKTKVIDNTVEEHYVDRFLWEQLLSGEDPLMSIKTPEELANWKEICIERLKFCIKYPEYKTKLLKMVWFK